MRTKDEKKRLAIRDATIREVVEGGLSAASVAKIAKRAKLSQGTIYLYFSNKEELIEQAYIETKLEIRDALLKHYNKNASSEEAIRNMWFALFGYAMDHPGKFAFTEYIVAANFMAGKKVKVLTQAERQLKSIIQGAVKDGTLRDAPFEALQSVLVAPISSLSRKMTVDKKRVSSKIVQSTFDLIWTGIANRQ